MSKCLSLGAARNPSFLLPFLTFLLTGCPRDVVPMSNDAGNDARVNPGSDAGDSGLPDLAPFQCSVVRVGTAGTVIRGSVLLPDRILSPGEVYVDGTGTIRCVDADCSAMSAEATRIECTSAVISPGLINAHDHINYTQGAPYMRTPERYEHRHDWRRGLRGHSDIPARTTSTYEHVAWGELRFVLGGATAVVGEGATVSTRGFIRNLDRNETEGLTNAQVRSETFPLGDATPRLLASGCGYPSIDTATSIVGRPYIGHVSEGIDAEARNEYLCIREGANDLVQSNSSFVHGVALLPPDIAEIARDGASLIWSPRSNVTLYGETAHAQEYARLGVNIALGTDWTPTGSMNMLRELRCADELNRQYYDRAFTDRDLWLMVTRNGAVAMDMDDTLGVIAVGRVADISVFRETNDRRGYRAVVAAEPADVALVLRAGVPLSGDSELVGQIALECDELDVCGAMKRVCAKRETGKTLAELRALNTANYALFFCGVPQNEPSCVPERNATGTLPNPSVLGSSRYTGALTSEDGDGDGIQNAMDNCPRVFNPVRPVDGMMQGNADGDADGDACDPCPLAPNTTECGLPDANDRDGDMVPNATDNCPDRRNTDQADDDADMRGNICDPCPNTANPIPAACPSTVYDVKTGRIAVNADVSFVGVVVTAVYRQGIWVQSDADTMGGAPSADNSAIFIFTSSMPTVAVGDRVNASGKVTDYFGMKQITMVTVTRTASGVVLPAPVVVTDAEITTGGSRAAALEGVLVRIENVTVSAINPPAGAGERDPTNEFVIGATLRVDDFLFLAAPFPAVGATFTSITGVLSFRNGSSKLLPRTAADLVP